MPFGVKTSLWPIIFDLHIYEDRESMWELTNQEGHPLHGKLSEEAGDRLFRAFHGGPGAKITMEVHENGASFATHFMGQKLNEVIRIT
jgi:hypothetical protein